MALIFEWLLYYLQQNWYQYTYTLEYFASLKLCYCFAHTCNKAVKCEALAQQRQPRVEQVKWGATKTNRRQQHLRTLPNEIVMSAKICSRLSPLPWECWNIMGARFRCFLCFCVLTSSAIKLSHIRAFCAQAVLAALPLFFYVSIQVHKRVQVCIHSNINKGILFPTIALAKVWQIVTLVALFI